MDAPRRGSTRDLLPMAIATACVVAAAFYTSPKEGTGLDRQIVANRLVAELSGRAGAIAEWEIHQRDAVERMADEPNIREGLAAALAGRDAGLDLDALLGRTCPTLDGCALYGADGTRLGDFRAREAPEALIRDAGRGRTGQSPLVATDALGRLDPPTANPRYAVLFATPVVVDHVVRGVLVGRARADRQLDPLVAEHPPGRTGETYVVDPRGYMVTRSRFHVPSQRAGEHVPFVLDRPAVFLRTPADLPTRPLTEIAEHHDGVDVNGYIDYRGVRVVGAWRWIEELGAGVITEMDAAEAFHR